MERSSESNGAIEHHAGGRLHSPVAESLLSLHCEQDKHSGYLNRRRSGHWNQRWLRACVSISLAQEYPGMRGEGATKLAAHRCVLIAPLCGAFRVENLLATQAKANQNHHD